MKKGYLEYCTPFRDFRQKDEFREAKVIHIRDERDEYGSFSTLKGDLPRGWGWLAGHVVLSAKMTEEKELFVRIF